MPKVSVIVPVYNVEPYLRKCLDSVINQSLTDIEIICVDDASTDDSSAIVTEYAARDPRIKILRHRTNRGLGAARNSGMAIATGKYINFVDSDDWMERTALELMYAKMEDSQADLLITGVHNYATSQESSVTKLLQSMNNYYAKCALAEGLHAYDLSNPASPPLRSGAVGKLYPKALLDHYQLRFPEGLIHEDEAFIWFYMVNVRQLYYLAQPLYQRLIHPGSIMFDATFAAKHVTDLLEILVRIDRFLSKRGLRVQYDEKYRKFFESQCRNVIARIGKNPEAIAYCQRRIAQLRYKCELESRWRRPWFSLAPSGEGAKRRKIVTIFGYQFQLPGK